MQLRRVLVVDPGFAGGQGQRIFVRVEEVQMTTTDEPAEVQGGTEAELVQLELFCGVQSLGVIEPGEIGGGQRISGPQHFREFSCDADMRLMGTNLARHSNTFLISYDTEMACKCFLRFECPIWLQLI